jgi:3'-phosphoadenosine 5'-phosphosulfate sulfotransferase (PAPS reductase)/FAD synthetase
MKVSPQELQIRLAWPLDMKLEYFCKIISQFVIHCEGECYQSFSGGKDSKVGTDIVDKIWDGTLRHITPNWNKLTRYPKPIKLFSNTGLEFPEIVDYVKQHEGVVIVKPKMGFTRVIKEVGVAVGSKMVTEMIERLKKYIANPSPKNEATRNLYLTGFKKDGTYSAGSKLSKRWVKLLDAPFNVSNRCCDILKKEPFESYHKETGKHPIVFTTVDEGNRRVTSYYDTGCNTFEEGKQKSRPLSIFTEADVWEYAARWQIRFAEVYYERTLDVEQLDGSFKTEHLEAETRTGCTFCMFGLHLESKKKNNRIQRLAISHPKYHDIIINKCGLGDILDWLKLDYKPKPVLSGCQSKGGQ